MSQQLRRVLAAVGLTAALLLLAAAPSRAAGSGKPMISRLSSVDVLSRAWSWLESFLQASTAPRAIHQKTVATGSTPVAPPPGPPPGPPPPTGQGNMIDPEGKT